MVTNFPVSIKYKFGLIKFEKRFENTFRAEFKRVTCSLTIILNNNQISQALHLIVHLYPMVKDFL